VPWGVSLIDMQSNRPSLQRRHSRSSPRRWCVKGRTPRPWTQLRAEGRIVGGGPCRDDQSV